MGNRIRINNTNETIGKYDVRNDPDIEWIELDAEEKEEKEKHFSPFAIVLLVLFGIFMIMLLEIVIFQKDEEIAELSNSATSINVTQVEVADETDAAEPKKTLIPGIDVIDGIDFSRYNEKKESIEEIMPELRQYDTLHVFVSTYYGGAEAILASNNLFRQHKELGSYQYYLVFPKEPKMVNVSQNVHLNVFDGLYCFTFLHGDDIQGDNIEVDIDVTYEDESEETCKLYVTKEYTDRS